MEPALRRAFGHPYSDPELATAFVTRGPWQVPLDYVVQAAGGAAFAVLFRRRIWPAILLENAALLAASPLVDRIHPSVRDGSWPPLTGNARAAAVSVSGHVLYAAILSTIRTEPPS